MKSNVLTILSAAVLLIGVNFVYADEGSEHGSPKGSMMEHNEDLSGKAHIATEDELIDLENVGNKICPVSGEAIIDGDGGEGVKVAYQGKIYNLCCSMCAKDFRKDPEKFVSIINEELERSVVEGDTEDHAQDNLEAHDDGHDHHDH